MGILQEILKTLSLPEFYFAMFRSATPVLLTTLGAMISSRSGTSNIALEGTMLITATDKAMAMANAQRSLTIVNFLFTVSTSDLLLGIFFYTQHIKTELVL